LTSKVENKGGLRKIGTIHPPAKARGILAKIDKISLTNKLFPKNTSRFLNKSNLIAKINKEYISYRNNMSSCPKNCTLLNIKNGEIINIKKFTEEDFDKYCDSLYISANNGSEYDIETYSNTCDRIFYKKL
jgi:hypothetical protein